MWRNSGTSSFLAGRSAFVSGQNSQAGIFKSVALILTTAAGLLMLSLVIVANSASGAPLGQEQSQSTPPSAASPPFRAFEFFDYWTPEDANVVMFSEFDNDADERVLWEWDLETGEYTRVFGDNDQMFFRVPDRNGGGLEITWNSFGFSTDASQVYFSGRYDVRTFWFIFDRTSGTLIERNGILGRGPSQDPIFPVEEPYVWQVGRSSVVDLTDGFEEFTHDFGFTIDRNTSVRLATRRDELDEPRLVYQDEINPVFSSDRAPITEFGYQFPEEELEFTENDDFTFTLTNVVSIGERLADINSEYALVSRTTGPLMAYNFDPEGDGPQGAGLFDTTHYDAMLAGAPIVNITDLLPADFQTNARGTIARYSNRVLVTSYSGGIPDMAEFGGEILDGRETFHGIVDLDSRELVASWISPETIIGSRVTPHLVGDGMLVNQSEWIREGQFIDLRDGDFDGGDQPGTLWVPTAEPTGAFCGVRSVETGVLEGVGRCFDDEAAFVDFLAGDDEQLTAIAGTVDGVQVALGTTSCTTGWIDIEGLWFSGQAFEFDRSDCANVVTAPGAPSDGVSPHNIDLLHVELPGGVQALPNALPVGSQMLERLMLLGDRSATGFGGVRLDATYSEVPRQTAQDVSLPFEDLGVQSEGPTPLFLTNEAYRAAGRDVSLGFFNGAFTVQPDAEFMGVPDDPGSVQFDVLWLVEDNGEDPQLLEAGEGFDFLVAPVLQPLRLLSAGDSYAAGEGNVSANEHRCARSTFAYSGRIIQVDLFNESLSASSEGAASLENRNQVRTNNPAVHFRGGNGARWAFVACTGAVSRNVWTVGYTNPSDPLAEGTGRVLPEEQHFGLPPDEDTQLTSFQRFGTQVTSPNAVTITMGGNDAGFSSLLQECFSHRAVFSAAAAADNFFGRFFDTGVEDVRGRECETAFLTMRAGGERINPRSLSTTEFVDQILRPRLAHTYDELKDAVNFGESSADPVVTVFGYPQLFQSGCWYSDFLGQENVQFLADAVNEANDAIEAESLDAGFAFVRPIEFDGHAICAEEPFVNGITLDFVDGRTTTSFLDLWADLITGQQGVEPRLERNRSVHPNQLGWEAYTEGWVRVNQGSGPRNAAGLLIPSNQPNAFSPVQLNAVSLSTSLSTTSFQIAQLESPLDLEVSEIEVTYPEGDLICGAEGFISGDTIQISIENGIAGSAAVLLTGVNENGEAVTEFEIDNQGNAVVEFTIPADFVGDSVLSVVETSSDDSLVLPDLKALTVHGSATGFCAIDDAVASNHSNATVTIDPLANDLQGTSEFRIETLHIRDEPVFGTVEVVGNQLVYAPQPHIRAVDAFTYGVCSTDGRCTTATVEIDMTLGCTIFGGSGRVTGTDGDDVICGTSLHEQINAGAGNDIVYTGGGQDSIDMGTGGGSAHFHESAFQVTAAESVALFGDGPNIAIRNQNDPLATPDFAEVTAGSAVIRPLENDSFPRSVDLSTFAIIGFPTGITVTSEDSANGTLELVLDVTPEGLGERIVYSICDLAGVCTTAEILVDVSQPDSNVKPVAADDQSTAQVGEAAIAVDVLANDSDSDGTLDPTSLRIINGPSNGEAGVTVLADGRIGIVYAPAITGEDSLTYQVCDAQGLCDQAVLSISVSAADPDPDPPASDMLPPCSTIAIDSFQAAPWTFTFQIRNTTAGALDFEFLVPNANYELTNLVFNGSGQNLSLDQNQNADGTYDITVSGTLPAFQSVGGQQPNGFQGAINPTNNQPETRCAIEG